MRCLYRNKQKFKYAVFIGFTEEKDDNNIYSGEDYVQYGTPVVAYANISEASGMADVEAYGTRLKYDKTLVMKELPAGFDENTALWIDNLDSDVPDYVVSRISKSLNFVTIGAMRKDRS